jgi:hypothetical protein
VCVIVSDLGIIVIAHVVLNYIIVITTVHALHRDDAITIKCN